jgi:hypothetical protein
MAKKSTGSGGLFQYGQDQLASGKKQKLFPAIEDINPQLKGKFGGNKKRGK